MYLRSFLKDAENFNRVKNRWRWCQPLELYARANRNSFNWNFAAFCMVILFCNVGSHAFYWDFTRNLKGRAELRYNLFFFKIFGGHKCFLWGHWYPCIGLLVTSPLGFKVGSLIRTWWRHICDIHSLRFTSSVAPASLLAASMAAGLFPIYMFQQR